MPLGPVLLFFTLGGTNCIFLPGLHANRGDHSNRGPAIENGTK